MALYEILAIKYVRMNYRITPLKPCFHVWDSFTLLDTFKNPKGGGGVLRISSVGNDRMGVKIKTQKIPRASNKTQNNPWTKN